jgi:DHA1 family bicyclomycin/chloramphenicol resistance-like MFS transporter
MPTAEFSPAPRPSFAILVAISAIGPLSMNILVPSMPGLEKSFNVPYGTVQLTLTLYLVGMAVCQLIYGPASDHYGRRPMLLIGLMLFFVASLGAAIAPNIHFLIAARLVQAIGGSAGIVLARAMVRDVYTREESASMISYVTMAFVVAPMVAPVLGGLLEEYADWRTGFWLLAVLGAAVCVAVWAILPETHVNRHKTVNLGFISNAAVLMTHRPFLTYAATLAFTSAIYYAFLGGAPHIVIDLMKETPLKYGLWFISISAAYMVANFLSGRYTQRFGIDRMIFTGNVIALLGALFCLVAALTNHLTPATLFLPVAFAGFGNGLTLPNGTAAAISVEPRMTGTAAGLAGFGQMLVGSSASQAVGSWQVNFPMLVFWLMAAFSLLALVIHLPFLRRS